MCRDSKVCGRRKGGLGFGSPSDGEFAAFIRQVSDAWLIWKENPPYELFIHTVISYSACVWVASSLIALFGKLRRMLLACGDNGRTAAAGDFLLRTSRKFIFLIKTPNCHVL